MGSNSNDFNPLSLLTAPISGAFNYAGGKAQADAAKYAADQTTSAARYAADQQQKSTAAALDFQKQQAAQDFNNAQAAQQGNYNQWAAKQGRLSTLGQSVGLKAFDIPAYVPLQQAAPSASGIAPSGPTQNASTQPVDTQNPNITTMGAAMNQPASAQGQSGTPAGMVTLRNQYGQIKQVPQQQASVYQGLGFKVVG